ncbi:MAG: hypothetical protein [Siphoviridae sp. ctjeG17]|nr:MAG: hypothetical protein [Siphoviridae sp. ctjeG17]
MVQSTQNTRNIIIGILLIFIVGVVAVYSQSFSLLGREVWTPRYFSASCEARADNLAEVVIPTHNDNAKWYHCRTENAGGKYIPNVAGVQCTYIVKNFDAADIKICTGYTEKTSDLSTGKCTQDLTGAFGNRQEFIVNAGDSIYIDTDRAFGDAELSAKYPSWGIKTQSPDGYKGPTTINCLTSSLSGSSIHLVGSNDALTIQPDSPFNAVAGLERAISSQAVTLKDVANGKPIYISRPQYYFMIKTADDGFEYVDTQQEYFSANIQCIPRTTGCSDEAKTIQLEQQSCDKFGGALVGYQPVNGDANQLCKYSCSAGKLSKTNDCIAVKQSCPVDFPLWDANTGQCTANVVVKGEQQPTNYVPLLIIAIFFIIAVIIVLLSKRRK